MDEDGRLVTFVACDTIVCLSVVTNQFITWTYTESIKLIQFYQCKINIKCIVLTLFMFFISSSKSKLTC